MPSETRTLLLITRGSDRLEQIATVTPELTKDLDSFGAATGFSRSDLLQLTRLILFVEGEHDLALLSEMIGPELAGSGVRLVPLRGTLNLPSVAESQVIRELDWRFAVLTDNTNATQVARGLPRTDEHEVDKLQRDFERQHRELKAFGLDKHDIVEYLHVDVCRRSAPTFPGWALAIEDVWKGWRNEGMEALDRTDLRPSVEYEVRANDGRRRSRGKPGTQGTTCPRQGGQRLREQRLGEDLGSDTSSW